jgi:hypothetical protein
MAKDRGKRPGKPPSETGRNLAVPAAPAGLPVPWGLGTIPSDEYEAWVEAFLRRAGVRRLPNGRVDRINAAKVLGIQPSTLSQWRWLGKGPAVYMVGGRAQYEIEDLLAVPRKLLPKQEGAPAGPDLIPA